ncbi:MAG: RNA polymerase sigma factor [Acidimicrobiia bacterium]
MLLNQQRSVRRGRQLTSRLARQAVLPVPNPDQHIVDRAEQEAVVAALSGLSFRDQEVLRLAYWEELPHAQIADVLGCSTGAVDVRVHRAIRRLKKALERTGHRPSGRPAVLPEVKEERC